VSSLAGKVAVVTGAGSGIGRALALGLAGRGARVAISDVNAGGLAETAAAISRSGAEAPHEQTLDVSDRPAFEAYAASVAEHFGVVHQIYNNAGIAFSRSVLETEYADYERVFGVNLWGVIHGTKAFLPHLIASGDGHVVNVSSLNGYMAQAGMTHYCTSKFAVRGFTESVRMEMLSEGLPVHVTSVHPGGVKTDIADAAMRTARQMGLPVTEVEERRQRHYNEKLLKMDPAAAARTVLDGVEARRSRVLVGNDAKLVDGLVRVLPSHYPRLVVAAEKRFSRVS
jgi:NAD(P)-dependent dehydrogenase (short-subunit alcohol dehydrogenase family)